MISEHASPAFGLMLDQLDLATLLDCVRDVHIRETGSLKSEVDRLTVLLKQRAPEGGNPVAKPTWLAQASCSEEPPLSPHLCRVEESVGPHLCRVEESVEPAATSIWPAQASRTEDVIDNGSNDAETQCAAAPHIRTVKFQEQDEDREADDREPAEERRLARTPTGSAVRFKSSVGVASTGTASSSTKSSIVKPKITHVRASMLDQGISELFRHGQGQGQQKSKTRLERLIMSPHFDAVISVIILINVVCMALETEYHGTGIESALDPFTGDSVGVRSQWPAAEQTFETLEWFFGIVFWAELLVRAYCDRLKMFKHYIAWLDMLVTASWTIGKVGMIGKFNPTVLKVVRVIRVMRLVKLLRFIESFDSLQLMYSAFVSSMMALMWSAVVLTLVLTFCALLLTELLHQYYFNNPVTVDEASGGYPSSSSNTWNMFLSFGTFTRSLFSMYELALANWPPLGRLLSEEVSQWFMIFTVGHKLVIGFAMVGVINGIFMQETFACVSSNDDIMVRQHKRQSKTLERKMRALFKFADVDGSGEVSLGEWLSVLEVDEVRAWLCSMGFDSYDIETAFWMLAGEDGRITEDELTSGVEKLRGPARSIDVVSILTKGSIGKSALSALDDVRAGPFSSRTSSMIPSCRESDASKVSSREHDFSQSESLAFRASVPLS